MRRLSFAPALILIASSAYAASVAVAPPVAEKKPHFTVTNGDSLRDDGCLLVAFEQPFDCRLRPSGGNLPHNLGKR